MAKSGKSFRANTTAPRSANAVKPSSRIGDRGVGKYPRPVFRTDRA